MYELRVLTGLNRGAALPLIGEEWLIGADQEADLVLLDSDIAPQHCTITVQESTAQESTAQVSGWVVTKQHGEITDDEGHLVEQLVITTDELSFALGTVWLTICAADTPWQYELPSAQAPVAEAAPAPIVTLAPARKKTVLPFLFGFISAVTIAATSTWAALYPSPEHVVAPTLPTIKDDREKLADSTAVEQRLLTMLSERELNRFIALSHQGEQVAMTGSLTTDQSQKLDRMMTRFHEQYRTPVTIAKHISAQKGSLPFDIVQIVSGPMASVVTSNGKRLFVGDEIEGLRLVSIDANKVVFKGKDNFEVSW